MCIRFLTTLIELTLTKVCSMFGCLI